MSKITISVIVYAPFMNITTIKTNKKQMNSSADTFFFFNNPLLRLSVTWYESYMTSSNGTLWKLRQILSLSLHLSFIYFSEEDKSGPG